MILYDITAYNCMAKYIQLHGKTGKKKILLSKI